LNPLTFAGEGFSEYFCTQLIGSDPQLRTWLDADAAEADYKRASAMFRSAQRSLRDREQARSTTQLLLQPLAELLDWRLGERSRIATEEQEEEGGVPLLPLDGDRVLARAVCIAPDAHLDAAPPGQHRRFAPSLSFPRVLRESGLTYGVLLNAFRLRLICVAGTLPSSIEFDLTAIADGTYPGLDTWKLLHALLRQDALSAEPIVLDRVREIGKQHQRKVTTELGQQVQRAVFRFMQGLTDHPANRGSIPDPVTPEFLGTLYQETLHLLYRLLFVLYAEDLALLPVDMLTYREGYALGQIVRLARDGGPDGLASLDPNGYFFEGSLRALFGLLSQGVKLGPEGEIKPYGGGLFDPGATAAIDGLAWGNATIADVLESLTVVPAPRGQVGKVRLSYRELNVEQLGSIYEGLLELAPAYAHERLWEVELDTRLLHLTDAQREAIRDVRGEIDLPGGSSLDLVDTIDDEAEPEEDEAAEDDQADDAEGSEDGDPEDDAEEKPKRKASAKKPLKVLREINAGQVYPRGGQKRKQSGSYYTNRTFVEFLVREALDPKAEGKSPKEILALKVVDPAMGSGHFLVGACRRLAEHLLAAYRRDVAVCQTEAERGGQSLVEDDLLVQAGVPDELRLVWGRQDDEQVLAVCRLLVAGHCLFGVDKNPLAVDLAKASLWLVTAASGLPLSFLDHRLRWGDSLLGIPAEEVVRPWIEPPPAKGKSKARKTRTIKPVELLISPPAPQGTFDYYAPNREALCHAFRRALVCLQALENAVEAEPTNFALHRAKYDTLRGLLEPWNHLHQLRVGVAFADNTDGSVDLINGWLEDLLKFQYVTEQQRSAGEPARLRGEAQAAFCWELEFPEVFYDGQGQRRADAGFSCVLGNPPWDKIKPERDGFYLQFDPLIRQLQGTEKNRRIERLHRERPEVEAEWEHYEAAQKGLSAVLLKGGIYAHQTAEVEEEVEGDDGEATVKRKTTGGDPDLFKLFLERAWRLAQEDGAVGVVMSNSLHIAQGATGLRKLLLERNRLRLLCNFDNERKLFPGIDNRQDFDLIIFDKGGVTEAFDAAFLTRETEHAIQTFRSHPNCMRLVPADIRRLSPQTLTFFEFKGRRDLDIVRKAYNLHPPFGQGLMPKLGLKYRREFDMGNSTFLFRARAWLRDHGCNQEPGETWRAADAEWYGSRGYEERPIAAWYAVFDGEGAVDYRVPWPIPKGKTLRRADLDDFLIRLDLPGALRFFGRGPDDGGVVNVFVPIDEAGPVDAPVYIPGRKFLGDLTIPPCLRPGDVFLPLMEGKWIHQHDPARFSFVSGSGSWVVTRPSTIEETDLIPHYFLARLDAKTRAPRQGHSKIGFRDVSKSSDERSFIASAIPSSWPCGHKLPVFHPDSPEADIPYEVCGLINTFVLDSVLRLITSGSNSLSLIGRLPFPIAPPAEIAMLSRQIASRIDWSGRSLDELRALLDAITAELFELTLSEYAYILTTFPLLDRDQPPLPLDYRLRATNKGLDRRPISFISRDLALLTYFDYLAGRLEVKPEPARVSRICPDGIPDPPADVVAFFAEAGVDIGGTTERAVAETGPIRGLRERVALARELGAIAYVPTIDRRRASFVERAAEAGGLSPEEGVLTPEMSHLVLRDKTERNARWQRAMVLWQNTRESSGPGINGSRPSPPAGSEPFVASP
jgi:hypothetical protein